MVKKLLPIGISTLEKIRLAYHYVDKTHYVARLVGDNQYCFLSRPRRFGKSLFIDTLKQAFLGNEKLFKGLYLEKHWDWSVQYPVVHLSFGVNSPSAYSGLHNDLLSSLKRIYEEYAISITETEPHQQLVELIIKLREKAGNPVVILIDEYDKPILDVIDNAELVKKNRDILRSFYGVIKDQDANIRFVMLTGVSKFSKVGVFSGLNNLRDISLNANYADICGYTEDDLTREFQAYLAEGVVDRAKLKHWYNGYNFNGSETQKVYNPFDILLFFSNNYEYRSYWFETGTPTFLIKLLQKNKYYVPELEEITVKENILSSFDIDYLPLTTILFQTGYLTIKRATTLGTQLAYVLGYPNAEVKASFMDCVTILGTTVEQKERVFNQLNTCLLSQHLNEMGSIFKSHFSSIPHDWYRNNDIQHYEGFYASIVYSFFCALGYDVIAEDTTNMGKVDLTVFIPDKIVILEFKLSKHGDAQSSLQQIKDKHYADKYHSHQKPIYLIGMSFDAETKNVAECVVEAYIQ